jgi:hypothetical protein
MLPTNYGLLSSDLVYYVSWHTALSYENITNCVSFGYEHVACRDSRSFKASKMIKWLGTNKFINLLFWIVIYVWGPIEIAIL